MAYVPSGPSRPSAAAVLGFVLLAHCLAFPVSAQVPPVASATALPAIVPIGRNDASTILGRPVLDTQGETAGRITDVLVDAFGAVKAAVVDVGGFMGVGQRRIAVAWSALRFDPATHTIHLGMNAQELAAAPEYKADSATTPVATRPQDITRPSETLPAGAPSR